LDFTDNHKADLDDIRGKYRKKVSEEFIEQSPSYSDSPEDSSEESDDDEDQRIPSTWFMIGSRESTF